MSGFELTNLFGALAVSSALNSLWLGLLVVLLTAGLLRLLPRPNAATRYAVWFTALVLMLAAPVLLLVPRAAPVPAAGIGGPSAAAWAVPVTAHWPLYASFVWLAVTAILLARIVWSLAHITGLKRRATLIGRRDNVRVLSSAEIRVPMAAGFIRRAIVFPQSVLAELSSEEFEQVLYHEMSHLRRCDDWTQLLQEIGRAVLFFNPAIYWIGRRLTIEREMACDDWVVSATGQARPYALCLTHLHELTRRASAPQLAPGATTRTRWQISARVEALLEPGRGSTPRPSRSGWLAAAALASAALVLAARTVPPVGVEELPVAVLAVTHLNSPTPPAISLAPRRIPSVRARLMAKRIPTAPLLAASQPPAADSYMLVRTWHVDVSPTYFVITVVFFEPPPPTVLNGI